MTLDRIIAWTHLLQYDQDMSNLFITNSRSVVEHLVEKTPEAKIVLSIDSIPLTNSRDKKTEKWQKSLIKQLELLQENPLPASEDIKIKSPFEKVSFLKKLINDYKIKLDFLHIKKVIIPINNDSQVF